MGSTTTKSAGHVIVDSLAAHGVRRVYCVPGESYLDVLDGLHQSPVQTIVCRHEGGAAYMAEAEGKFSGVPGVAMVTRGPGAANAFVAVHTAWQDATPMVLFVGLIPVPDRDREAFQEFDLKAWFGTSAKRVFVLDSAERASEIVAEAFFAAQSGRPGPVVVGLPEDVITEQIDPVLHPSIPVAGGGMSATDTRILADALAAAAKPLVVTGGNDWTPRAAGQLTAWLERHRIPSLSDWRANGVVPSDSPAYGGSLGYGRDQRAVDALNEADLVIAIGTVLGDVLTDGYTARQDWAQTNIVVSIDTSLRGRSGGLRHQIVAKPAAFAAELDRVNVTAHPEWEAWTARLHADHCAYATLPEAPIDDAAPARMSTAMTALVPDLARDAVVTFGAGNHTAWPHKFFPTRVFASMLSTRNGSMGYSVPAAVAASLATPGRRVVSVAGDGEFMMNSNELATAVQYGATPLVIVMDNGQYGTIRAHQEAHYPGRVSGTQLANPDFAQLARGYGAYGEKVTRDGDVAGALKRALAAIDEDGVPAVLHLVVDPEVMLP